MRIVPCLSVARLPASTTPRQRLQVVSAAIDVLGLDDVRHQLIGNEEVSARFFTQPERMLYASQPAHLLNMPSYLSRHPQLSNTPTHMHAC